MIYENFFFALAKFCFKRKQLSLILQPIWHLWETVLIKLQEGL